MKKILLSLVLCSITSFINSQNANVEKSTSGIQTGFLGAWYYNEIRLTNKIALRSELGLGFDFDGFTVFATNLDRKTFGMAPVLIIEPRWYYNLGKRFSKSKNTSGNSGNFLSIKTTYNPNWFIITIPNTDSARVSNQISIIPTWGMKRNIGKHLNFETGFGMGYRYNFDFFSDKGSLDVNLHLRIGYRFK